MLISLDPRPNYRTHREPRPEARESDSDSAHRVPFCLGTSEQKFRLGVIGIAAWESVSRFTLPTAGLCITLALQARRDVADRQAHRPTRNQSNMKLSVLGLILSSVLLSSAAQLLLKFGMSSDKVAAALNGPSRLDFAAALATNLGVIAGLALYGLGALVWLLVLGETDVSQAYPFMGLAFVFTMFMAYFILHEDLSIGRIVGTLIVALGIAIVAKS